MKRVCFVLIMLIMLSSVYAQSTKVLKSISEKEFVTLEEVCYLAAVQKGLISENASFTEAFTLMSKSNQIPANQQPDMPVPYVNLSYIYAQTWNVKGGIMYRIFKSAPRYAFKQLKYDGILEKNIDSSRIVTGKEAVEIFNKCKIKYGNQNK